MEKSDHAVVLKTPDGRTVLRYLFGKLPEAERPPSVEGSGYTHPLHSPSGDVVTDLGPADHPHHRGVFCAWVQVEGEAKGDWWGWGALAPKEGRLIRNERIEAPGGKGAALRARNRWLAEGAPVLMEELRVEASHAEGCNVVDYEYRFSTPTERPAVIARNPFGGFCYRARPRGALTVTAPEGEAKHPDSVFNRAETNWPARPWYDFTYRSPEGRVSGVALLDHPKNPRSTWHVVRPIHMLNPCIVAEGPVTVRREAPLVLRYRLVVHDGPADPAVLDRLHRAFTRE